MQIQQIKKSFMVGLTSLAFACASSKPVYVPLTPGITTTANGLESVACDQSKKATLGSTIQAAKAAADPNFQPKPGFLQETIYSSNVLEAQLDSNGLCVKVYIPSQ